MGKVNWYLPAWLDRVLPHISIEGAEYFQRKDEAPAPSSVPGEGAAALPVRAR